MVPAGSILSGASGLRTVWSRLLPRRAQENYRIVESGSPAGNLGGKTSVGKPPRSSRDLPAARTRSQRDPLRSHRKGENMTGRVNGGTGEGSEEGTENRGGQQSTPSPAGPADPVRPRPRAHLSRRSFLAGGAAAGIAAGIAGLGGRPTRSAAATLDDALSVSPSGAGSLADIEHVVVLMQENRSFDHYFGTLSSVGASPMGPFPSKRSAARATRYSTSSGSNPG
jgi:hypothetical protein